jgi:glucosamine-6-phosphate isomerase
LLSFFALPYLYLMQLHIFQDYESLSAAVAGEVIDLVKNKPDAVICLASGATPRGTCLHTVERAVKENVDFSKITFIGLDEWVGIAPENDGSCYHFFDSLFIKPLQLSASQVHLFNALSADLDNECKKMDKLIAEKGGIDLVIVGIGMNGHIGFNEPGVSFNLYSHVIDLDELTVSGGQKYFRQATVLKQGITLGLQHFMESKKAILMANSGNKAAVIRKALNDNITNEFPATIIRQHANGHVMIDADAASLLK